MAELQVGIRADVKDAKRVVKSLKDIKKAAGEAGVSMSGAAKTAKSASVSYKVASGSALQLAGATNLTSAANAALSNTLLATAGAASKSAASQAAAATSATALAGATTRSSAAARALAVVQTKLTAAVNATTGAFGRMGAAAVAAYTGATAASKRFLTQARTALGSVVGASTAAAGIGATLAVGFAVGAKSAVTLEDTMNKIVGLVGVARDEVEGFKKPLRDLSTVVGKDVNELADALFFVTSAGFRGQQALDVLESSAMAAAAGLGETKQVADAVTSAINAYGAENLSAAQATDVLVATVREGKAEADSIAGALGQVLPIASELGVGFEQLGGTIAALTRIGLGADQGATALGATLAAIQKPTADARAALKGVGLDAEQLRKKVREEGLLTVLQDLKGAFGDNEEAIARVFPNVRALRAVLPLVGVNAKQVKGVFDGVADSAGSTADAFAAVSDGYKLRLQNALNELKNALRDMGETILPAITIAFEKLVGLLGGIADGFAFAGKAAKAAGEGMAAIFVGSDDPVIRNLNNIRELREELDRLEGGGSTRKFFTEVGGIELAGSRDDQLQQLRERLALEKTIEMQIGREELQRQRANQALADARKEIEEIGEITADPVIVIDQEKQDAALKTLKSLKDEVSFLRMEATNLQELGQEGIGLAEDFKITSDIARDLQGDIAADAAVVRSLVNEKRELEAAIQAVTDAFARQDAATQFLDDLARDTALLEEQISSLQSGGSLFDIASLQQARDIYADLSVEAQALTSPEAIQRQIQTQQVLNDVLKAMPVDKMRQFADSIAFLEEQRGLAKTEEELARIDGMIATLGESSIQSVFDDLGIAEVPFDSLEQQFKDGYDRIKMAFDLAGVVDPESDPRFQAAIDRLKNKMTGVGDIMKTFGEAAAQNLQSSFSDFLFDPFEDGLDGMAKSFGDMLKRLASDLLANMILMKFLQSLSGFGGGVGAIANAGISALGGGGQGGFAEGGTFVGGKPMLVGEKGPEVITPQKGGTVIPNDMLGGQAPAPEVNVAGPTIVNTIEDSQIVAAFNRGGGGQVILNDMAEKKQAYRNALGL